MGSLLFFSAKQNPPYFNDTHTLTLALTLTMISFLLCHIFLYLFGSKFSMFGPWWRDNLPFILNLPFRIWYLVFSVSYANLYFFEKFRQIPMESEKIRVSLFSPWKKRLKRSERLFSVCVCVRYQNAWITLYLHISFIIELESSHTIHINMRQHFSCWIRKNEEIIYRNLYIVLGIRCFTALTNSNIHSFHLIFFSFFLLSHSSMILCGSCWIPTRTHTTCHSSGKSLLYVISWNGVFPIKVKTNRIVYSHIFRSIPVLLMQNAGDNILFFNF